MLGVSVRSDELEARLVVGDELMAKGLPGGELVVVQCELERGGFDRRRGIELRKREVQLVAEAKERLRETPLQDKAIRFRRGAIDAIAIDCADYVRDEDAIWRLAPELRHVAFHGLKYTSDHVGVTPREDDWLHVRDRLAPALKSGRIRSVGLLDAVVEFEPPSYPDEWAYLVSPIEGIASVTDEIAQWLVDSKTIATLEGLDLPDIHSQTFKLLLTEPSAAQLDDVELGIGRYKLDDSAVQVLSTTKLAPRRLALRFTRDEVIDRRWTESPFLSRVSDLTVPNLPELGSIGRQLRRLEVNACFEPGWVERIANAPELAGLEELVIGGREPGKLDIRALCEPKHLDALRVLRIRNGVDADAMRELLRSPLGQRLELMTSREP